MSPESLSLGNILDHYKNVLINVTKTQGRNPVSSLVTTKSSPSFLVLLLKAIKYGAPPSPTNICFLRFRALSLWLRKFLCMRQVLGPGALGRPRGIGWTVRWEGRSGWGIRVNPWLIHVNVWQKSPQYCKVISLQLIKISGKKKRKFLSCPISLGTSSFGVLIFFFFHFSTAHLSLN